tara:strand:- start:141 stop:494 length:354 start_codon:yes stop_codon:yes gene_type:complete
MGPRAKEPVKRKAMAKPGSMPCEIASPIKAILLTTIKEPKTPQLQQMKSPIRITCPFHAAAAGFLQGSMKILTKSNSGKKETSMVFGWPEKEIPQPERFFDPSHPRSISTKLGINFP